MIKIVTDEIEPFYTHVELENFLKAKRRRLAYQIDIIAIAERNKAMVMKDIHNIRRQLTVLDKKEKKS